MAFRRASEYPRTIYGPHGATMTVNSPSDWPMGWSAAPDVDSGAPVVPRMGLVPLPRVELKKRLRAAGVPFRESDGNSALWALLQERG